MLPSFLREGSLSRETSKKRVYNANQNPTIKFYTNHTKMRLLTHNLLQCHVKNCTNNYPLRVESAELESLEIEYNEEFLKNVLWSKIDWKVLKDTAFDVCGIFAYLKRWMMVVLGG